MAALVVALPRIIIDLLIFTMIHDIHTPAFAQKRLESEDRDCCYSTISESNSQEERRNGMFQEDKILEESSET